MTVYANTPWEKLEPGMTAEVRRTVRSDDLYVFASASGNLNPMHLPKVDGDGDGRPEAVAPSMWLGALISAALGNHLPGPGTLYLGQTLRFTGRAHAGDEVVVRIALREKGSDRLAVFDCRVETLDGGEIVAGEARVQAPAAPLSFTAEDMPGLTVQRHQHFDRLLEIAAPLPPLKTAVVAPEGDNALAGALLGARHTLIEPLLIGDEGLIRAAAERLEADLSEFQVVHEPSHAAAAALGVKMVHDGRAQALMKGKLHTDVLLGAVVKRDGGLRTGRRLSHVFVMDVPGLDHLLLITDAAINIAPDLETKVDITQNAIDLAHALGLSEPKVGVLSAVETVNAKIPSTLDAAALSKMSERGQITGGIVDGPLAMDNAIDLDAAKTKGIHSLVAGRAEILVVPNLEAGNMLAKQLTFVAHAEAGGVVMGARAPVILTSRADDDKARLASCAVAVLSYVHGRAHQ